VAESIQIYAVKSPAYQWPKQTSLSPDL